MGRCSRWNRTLLERVFLVGDMNVDSIMTHKHDMVWFDINMNASRVRETMGDELYELYPVCNGSLDEVLGVVSIKDLLFTLGKPTFALKDILTKPTYFYRNMSVYKVLELMKREGVSRGLVCDEFGSCIGIVTLKDMMHALVGTVDSEDEECFIVQRQDKEEWLVDGKCPIQDFLSFFHRAELYENTDYTSVAGLCLAQLQHIPHEGEKLSWNGFCIEISDMDGARIDKVIVSFEKIESEN